MPQQSEKTGRTFGLGFLFDPFQLTISGSCLVTPDLRSVIVTEYHRVSG
jgi:hypothetical protein